MKLRNKEELLDEVRHIQTNSSAKSLKITRLQQEWNCYMVYGGYPAVVTEPDMNEKIAYLKEIRDSFVKRDILESGVQNETAFNNLFRLIAGQTGNLINMNELASTLRVKNETINNYLFILQKCFHIALIKPFFNNLRKELTKMPKAYLMDNGLRNCLINHFEMPAFRMDKGELWENMFFRLLLDKYDVDDISFWRTTEDNEVDFVLRHRANPYAVEVKYDKNAIRESKYKMFGSAYPDIPLQFAWIEPFDEDFFRRIL